MDPDPMHGQGLMRFEIPVTFLAMVQISFRIRVRYVPSPREVVHSPKEPGSDHPVQFRLCTTDNRGPLFVVVSPQA
eukprot:4182265-Alexandrium_andersonii.AAC.1